MVSGIDLFIKRVAPHDQTTLYIPQFYWSKSHCFIKSADLTQAPYMEMFATDGKICNLVFLWFKYECAG